MAVLVDTNILLRLSQAEHAQRPMVDHAVRRLRRKNEALVVAAQNIVEFWAVATRPSIQNGLAFTIEQAGFELADITATFDVLPELPLQDTWENLVKTYRVSGKGSHDARLVAAMMVHGVGSILTFDADFARYPFLTVLDPRILS